VKIYDVIREICISADNYDDEFIKKYQAEYYERPHINRLTNEHKEQAWNSFRTISDQYKKYVVIFEQNLWIGSIWDIMAISMLNIANMPYVHGTLRTELDEALAIHYDTDLNTDYRLDMGKSYLKRLFNETTREQFLENIYLADIFISVKTRSSVDILMSVFDMARENVIKEINDGNHLAAAYTMMLFFLRLIYDYNLEGKHQDVIYDTLEKAGGTDCKLAVPVLWKTYEGFLHGRIAGGPYATKGFFARLFG